MAIEDTITQLVADAQSEGLSLGRINEMVRDAGESAMMSAVKSEIATLPVPKLTGQAALDLQSFFRSRKSDCPIRPDLAVMEIATAFRESDQDGFWRGIYLLLTMLRAQLQHLDSEFEDQA